MSLPSRLLRAFVAGSLLATLAVTGAVTSSRTVAEAAWAPPSFVRSIGGTGRAGVYAWGLAHNPVSNEIIVSDYLNFRVRRYSMDGRHLGDLEERAGEPWSVATDPNSGDIYVMNNWDNRLERYDVAGNHIRSISVSSGWNAWIDVDNRGWIWVIRGGPQATNYRLDYYDPNGTKLGQWSINPPAPLSPTMFGIEVADDGRVFLNDGNNGLIHVYAANGTFERSFGEGYLSGDDQRGLTLDEANGWLYVSDASVNRIVKFTMAGDYLASFSKTGEGPGELNGPRQLAVDSEGDVWVADFGNHRFHEFAPDGTALGTYPDPAQSPPAGHLSHASDSVVDSATGSIWIADTYNQRFNRIAADGTPTGTWGKRGGIDGYGMNYPSTIGFDPVLRRVWVGMEEGRHLKVYDDNANYLFIVGDQTKTPESEGYLRNVTDIDFFGDKAFISDEQAHDIKVLDASTGEELYVLDAYDGSGWSGNHGLAIHPDTGDLYVASYSLDQVSVFDQAGNLKFRFGSRGSGDGQFRSPRDVAIIDDVVYVSDAELSRVQAFSLDGSYLGRFGGWGDGPYNFRNPMGLDTDANGMLYVTDVENSRITVFDPAVPKPAFKWGRPIVTLDAPSDGQVFVGDQLTISGTATDDDGLANIEVNVRRESTGLWWNGQTASWQAAPYPNLALWSSPTAPATAATFDWFFPAIERGATYRVDVVARDRHGTTSLGPSSATVTIADPGLVDLVDPTVAVTVPAAGSLVVAGEQVVISGTAGDDVAVDAVDVAIMDTATSAWWSPTTGWGPLEWIPSSMSAPGTVATDWAFDWTPTSAGQFEIHSRATDLAGNSALGEVVGFLAIDAGDSEPPDATVATPAANQPETLGPISISGAATDNAIVAAVEVSIRNNDSGQWLRPDGTWGGFARLPASLSVANTTSTEWSFLFDPPSPGSYGLSVRAVDAAGNIDPTKPWVSFTVVEADGDTTAPDVVVTSPTPNQAIPANWIVLTGSATDDTAVSEVAIALRNIDTGDWLGADGSWGTFAWHPTVLSAPGEQISDWTWSIDALAPGTYGFIVRTTDASGNLDPTRPWVRFTTQ